MPSTCLQFLQIQPVSPFSWGKECLPLFQGGHIQPPLSHHQACGLPQLSAEGPQGSLYLLGPTCISPFRTLSSRHWAFNSSNTLLRGCLPSFSKVRNSSYDLRLPAVAASHTQGPQVPTHVSQGLSGVRSPCVPGGSQAPQTLLYPPRHRGPGSPSDRAGAAGNQASP